MFLARAEPWLALMRLAVYTDYHYRRVEGRLYAERAFALFLVALADHLERLVIVGKVNPALGQAHYLLPPDVGFVELPYFESLARPRRALGAMARSLGGYWRLLDDVDGVWLLGPHPLAVAFAGLAMLRRKSVALGVRQDFRRYVRARHPDRRWIHLAGDLLELCWRLMARFVPVVVVGRALAAGYPSRRTLEIAVSLVSERDIATPEAAKRDYAEGELRVLSVGRLEAEKNPLLLADILALLREHDSRWRLTICGEGPMEPDLRWRLERLGLSAYVDMLGYVPYDRGLGELYRRSHALLHVSWTEGLPQVLFEAFAARLPVVATAVGGVAAAAHDAALLCEPGDAQAPVDALIRIAQDAELRRRLSETGVAGLRSRTLEAEARRVARFVSPGPADC